MPERRPRWGCIILLAMLLAAAVFGWQEYRRLVREQPELFPWTPLSLADPVGSFTAMKIAQLGDEPGLCRALVEAAGPAYRLAPDRRSSTIGCGYVGAMRSVGQGPGSIDLAPAGLVTACPVAAALLLWERDVVQPAALRHLGEPVARVDHFGSYSCRRLYGRGDGPMSEHATANAVDIAGFRTAGGKRISVAGDWREQSPEAAFLREVRDGACRLFATVLSPDYNSAHADHLHFDQASRGKSGWRACR